MSTSAENMSADPRALMRSIIQRIATGPELSKDISREEARAGMRLILDGEVDPVQAAIFLIALRMKRETDDENLGVLEAIRDATETVTAAVDEVVIISDPYDGYNRTLPASPFLPLVLAELGVPTLSEGVETVGPKYGLTHRQVLRAAGVAVDRTPTEAAARLADERIGWAYVDQSRFCPKLHALLDLRSKIVKRPAITTVEVLTGPVRGRQKTHLISGYVHKPYPRLYSLLARHMDFDSLLLVRGVEGGVIPSLRQAGRCVYYHDKGEEQGLDMNPVDLGIVQTVRAAPLPEDLPKAEQKGDEIAIGVDMRVLAAVAADAGRDALQGKAGPIYDGLVYSGALILQHLHRYDSLLSAADAVRRVLDSGAALSRLRN